MIVLEAGQEGTFGQIAAGPFVDLERHEAAQGSLPGEINVGQRSFAEQFDDLELADHAAMARAGLVGQRLRVDPGGRGLDRRPVLVRGTHRTSRFSGGRLVSIFWDVSYYIAHQSDLSAERIRGREGKGVRIRCGGDDLVAGHHAFLHPVDLASS